jgi:DNA segregation ATPase FtsK/SpoIIIE-like protein
VVTGFVDTISGSVESSSSKLQTKSTVSPTRKHTYFSVISYMQRMFSVKTNIYVAIRHSMFFEN